MKQGRIIATAHQPVGFRASCLSQPHRGVAGLARLVATDSYHSDLPDDLRQSDPMDLAQIAQAHFVDTSLAPAIERHEVLRSSLPEDLVLFFGEMHAGNTRRNAALKAQLTEIGAEFGAANVKAVALKGAAELLAPLWPNAGSRYLSDLDILVAEEDLAVAIEVLNDLGATPEAAEMIDWDVHHHITPYVRDDWSAQVELHKQVGGRQIGRLLTAEDVFATAI